MEEFLFLRNYQQSTILEQTGDEQDKVKVAFLETTKDTTSKHMAFLKENLRPPNDKSFKLDFIEGSQAVICVNLNQFAQTVNLLALPTSFEAWKNIKSQCTLKQLGIPITIQQEMEES